MALPIILTVGSINMDAIARDLLFHDPQSRSTTYRSYSWKIGGKGLNQSCTIARLGGESDLVGCVGRDEQGRAVLQALRDNRVGTDHVRVTDEAPTGLSFLGVAEDGTYALSNSMGATGCLREEDVARALEQRHYDMVVMQFELPQEVMYRTYELARDRGIPTILDAGPPRQWSLDRLSGIFMITPNAAEALALSGVGPEDEATAREAARIIAEKSRAQYVLIKMGDKGAYLFTGGQGRMFPTFTSVRPVDSTGCGDVFTACVAIRTCLGCSMEKAVTYANAAASLACTKYGGLDSIPSPEEVEKFLAAESKDELWK